MRRPTMADKLSAFEAFRPRGQGRPPYRGAPRRPQVRSAPRERRSTIALRRRASARRWSRRSPMWQRRSARRSASAERTELSLFALANGGDARRLLAHRRRGVGQAVAPARRGGDLRGAPLRVPLNETAIEYFRWRQDEANVLSIDCYCTHVLSQSGADATAVPRILYGLGPDEKVQLSRRTRSTSPPCRRGSVTAPRCASIRSTPTATRPAASSST